MCFHYVCLVERMKRWKNRDLLLLFPYYQKQNDGKVVVILTFYLAQVYFPCFLEKDLWVQKEKPPTTFSFHSISYPYQTRENDIFISLFIYFSSSLTFPTKYLVKPWIHFLFGSFNCLLLKSMYYTIYREYDVPKF